MTYNEWQQLGLLGGSYTVGLFNEGKFISFFIEDALIGDFRLVATSGNYGTAIIGRFATREQAEVVSLTLRMANPR